MVRRLTISEARKDFADLVNRAHYGQEVCVVTKHGRDFAAIVPLNHSTASQTEAPPKKMPKRVR